MGPKIGAAALAALVLGGTAALPAAAQTATKETITIAFQQADRNGDGALNLDEYIANAVVLYEQAGGTATKGIARGAIPGLTTAQFNAIDRNRDGRISLGEFVAEKVIEFFDADTNHDGVLSVTEVIAAE
ncbi:MAG: EF-hand domain-containing protein [Amaricoccus sp.]